MATFTVTEKMVEEFNAEIGASIRDRAQIAKRYTQETDATQREVLRQMIESIDIANTAKFNAYEVLTGDAEGAAKMREAYDRMGR